MLRTTTTTATTTATAALNFARRKSKPVTPKPPPSPIPSPSSSSPGPIQLISALSHMNYTTALFAGKAFGIATLIVASSAFALTWSVKTMMDIKDTRDFAYRARKAVQTCFPSLVSSIHKSHDDDDVDAAITPAPWNAEHSEKRLNVAYEKGGLPLWTRTALVEMEQELRYEREKRESND